MELPRGIRNNNPGNVDRSKIHWAGEVFPGTDERFATFSDMAFGVRCSAKILLDYYLSHGIHTIGGMIRRWAPPNENDPVAYAEAVAKACGVNPTDSFNITREDNLEKMLAAVFNVENGGDFVSQNEIAAGASLALKLS